MTVDIERLKKTKVGRAWLSVFVRRVWERLDVIERARILNAHAPTDCRWEGDIARALGDAQVRRRGLAVWCEGGRRSARARTRLVGMGLLGRQRDRHFPLTPLGVKVYLYGRRETRKRGGR